jgi:2-dehydro-3-deoxyphosphooctonate aldolase (KDO 8-P synthase)
MDKKYLADKGAPFFLISGPCVVEGEEITLKIAHDLANWCSKANIPLIFKASYKKANRTRLDSFTGIGDEKALKILRKVKTDLNLPVITDIHSEAEAKLAAEYVDVLQIPAFLCRQTELLIAAAETGKWVSIKKGQFMSPESMSYAVDKVKDSGNNQVMLTERGTTFGYQDLVVDFRGIPKMKSFGVPVVLDCTHSLQQPNQSIGVTGGMPELIEHMARLGITAGVDGLFMETHPNPSQALSDGANMLPLDQMPSLLKRLNSLGKAVSEI